MRLDKYKQGEKKKGRNHSSKKYFQDKTFNRGIFVVVDDDDEF